MSTFAQLKEQTKAWSGELDDTRLGLSINAIYKQIVNRFFWPQLVIQKSITLEVGKQFYDLDPLFRWIKTVWYRNSADGTPIPISGVKRVLDNFDLGTPDVYRIDKDPDDFDWRIGFESIPNGNHINVYPNMSYEFYYSPPNLSAGSDVPRFDADDHHLIALGAAVLLTARQSDTPGYAMINDLWKDGLGDMEEKSINFMGSPIVVPGAEITESNAAPQPADYGRRVGGGPV